MRIPRTTEKSDQFILGRVNRAHYLACFAAEESAWLKANTGPSADRLINDLHVSAVLQPEAAKYDVVNRGLNQPPSKVMATVF